MWVFFTEGTGEFAGWYVNLEKPHVRDEDTVYTSDHVLDLVISPDRTMVRKDEDELAIAVAQGVFDATRRGSDRGGRRCGGSPRSRLLATVL